jgi:hypothetical protein
LTSVFVGIKLSLFLALAMLIAHISKISRKFIEMAVEEMNLYAHVAA